MKKTYLIICIIILFVLTGCGKKETLEDTEFTKLSLNGSQENSQNIAVEESPKIPVETEINSYSSPVLDKSEGRVNNLQIGCSYINRICSRTFSNIFF